LNIELMVINFPDDADRAYLIADCGLLTLVDSGKAFTSESPEILELMGRVLAKSGQWLQHFSLNFTVGQAPISFFTRLVKKTLKGEIYRSRPGTVDRQYHYQVMTVELMDEQLAMMGVEPPLGLAIKEDQIVAEDEQVVELLMMRDRILVRGLLLDAAVARYLGITSKLLLDVDSINGSVDAGVCEGRGGC
jgi:hypothetical protein